MKNEHFNILILSETDARKKSLSFNLVKKTFIALIVAVAFLFILTTGLFIYLSVQNANSMDKIAALEKNLDEQKTVIAYYTEEFLKAQMAASADIAEPSPSIAQNVNTPRSPTAIQEARQLDTSLTKAINSTYAGTMGESFQIKTVSLPTEETGKVKFSSSNTKVAKVSKDGHVTLLSPGQAKIMASEGKSKNTVCNITCTSPFDSVHYCQGDSQWHFPETIGRRACIISSFAILLQNAGVPATPRSVYNVNRSLSLRFPKLTDKFNIKFVNALSDNSPYLKSFDGNITTIKDPGKNYVAAVKEALDRNPEGVCIYFKGNGAHMIVAVGYIGNVIYYSDPGRRASKGFLVDFSRTWVYYKHRMTYRYVKYMVAIDKNQPSKDEIPSKPVLNKTPKEDN